MDRDAKDYTHHLPKVCSPHEQVEAALVDMVAHLRPGDQLPPEPELAKLLGVSRPTLREALQTFAERGMLIRRHGVGTFVGSRLPILEAGLEVLESLDSLARRLGLEIEMLHLAVHERQATAGELKGLNLTAQAEPSGDGEARRVLVVDRVIAIAGEPVADLRDVVPVRYLQQADLGVDFRGSVLDLLCARQDPPLSISRTEIIAEVADPDQAERLDVAVGAPLLKLVAQLFSYDECVVDYSVSTFVPGHFHFHVMRQVRD
jgi:GntR family transcriptional regulator